MYNVFTLAINEVKNSIPKKLLEDAFSAVYNTDINFSRDTPLSIDYMIKKEVIYNRVLIDLNLINTSTTYIPLDRADIQQVNSYNNGYSFNYVCVIDKSTLSNKSIISVLSLYYQNRYSWGSNNYYNGNSNYGNMISASTNVLSNAIDNQQISSTSRVNLLNENTVLISDNVFITNIRNCLLECILSIDEYFSSLNPKSYSYIKELVVLATKAYVYNILVLAIDQGRLVGGQDLGRFREILDGYADANELYKEYLKNKVAKVLFMNNDDNMRKFIGSFFGAPR